MDLFCFMEQVACSKVGQIFFLGPRVGFQDPAFEKELFLPINTGFEKSSVSLATAKWSSNEQHTPGNNPFYFYTLEVSSDKS